MSHKFIFNLIPAACLAIQIDIVLAGYGERLSVGGEGMVRNGMVEELMDVGSGHDDYD